MQQSRELYRAVTPAQRLDLLEKFVCFLLGFDVLVCSSCEGKKIRMASVEEVVKRLCVLGEGIGIGEQQQRERREERFALCSPPNGSNVSKNSGHILCGRVIFSLSSAKRDTLEMQALHRIAPRFTSLTMCAWYASSAEWTSASASSMLPMNSCMRPCRK